MAVLKAFGYATRLFLLAGTTLLLIFIVLSGSMNHFPFNRFYWIEADTSSISGAPDVSRWTYWGLASKIDGKSVQQKYEPAYPFSPVDNFDTHTNIPQDFIDNRDVYYYLSRFAFAFFWIALAFVGVALILTIFTCWPTVLKTASWLTTLGLLFTAGGVAFETAISVMGKNAFGDNNLYAHLGASLLGISWAAVTCLIILFFISWWSVISNSYKKHKANVEASKAEKSYQYQANEAPAQQQVLDQDVATEDPYAQQKQGTLGGNEGIKFFKIRRHNKEDSESV